jgi:tetratricopeptide (TPR) repeat protein/transcriptional regulator with XRE-family HTH domain
MIPLVLPLLARGSQEARLATVTTARDPDTQPSFADLLRRARRDAGLTQEELAERAGLSARAITAIERGISRAPHKTTVELLCGALELPREQYAVFLSAARRRPEDDTPDLPLLSVDGGADGDSNGDDSEPLVAPSRAVGGFLGALPDHPIVTREVELRQIGDALDATLHGSAKILFLAGEPGVGKTRLAQEATLAAQSRGYLVVTGRCQEPYQAMPYYPFVEALLAAVTNAAPAVREELPRSWPEVQRLLPGSIQDTESSGAYRRAEEQQRLFWSITRFFQALAFEQPIALLLDDLHWADDASLSLLQHLAQHTRASRVFILCAYRDTDLSRRHPLRRILHDLARERLADRLTVTRLSQGGTGALVATIIAETENAENDVDTSARPPAALIEAIHRSTDGNPFFTVEVLRALQQRGEMRSADGRWEWRSEQEILVPESVQAAIDERLARLDPGAQELLEEASILGERFVFDDLVALQQRDEEDVEEALEAAITAALVQEIGPDNYCFNHVLTQQALYHGISRRRRRRLHLAAGAAFERLPQSQRSGHASELAWHFLQADEPARALPYVIQAGDQAQVIYAYAAAENRYRTAVELARSLQDTAQEAVVQARRGTALAGLARWDEALVALRRAADLDRAAGAYEALAQDVALMARVYNDHGTPETGIEMTRPYLEQLPTQTPAGALARVYTALSYLYLASGLYHELLAMAERALALASEAGDPRLLAEAKGRHCAALATLGRFDEALPSLHEVVRLAEEADALETQVVALNNIAHSHMLIGPLDTSRDTFARAIELAPRLHSPIILPLLMVNHANACFLLGEWQRAHADLNSAQQIAQEMGVNALSASLLVMRGRLYLAEGRPSDAARVIAEGLALGEPDAQTFSDAQSALAERELRSGRPVEARDRLAPLVTQAGMDEPDLVGLLPLLAWAYLEMGEIERAASIAAEAIQLLRAMGMRVMLVNALRIQAMVAQRQGDRDTAETTLAEAVSLADAISYPYAKAQALFIWAQLAPDDEASQERLREAHTIFTRLCASGDAARAERALKSR